MKIRAITYFVNPGFPIDLEVMQKAGNFVSAARQVIEATELEVQSTRLASIPFPHLLSRVGLDKAVQLAVEAERAADMYAIDYLSLGPAQPNSLVSYKIIPKILAETQKVFMAGIVADNQQGVSLPALRACADIIKQTASITPDGFTNLRFATLANVPPGSPFFPAAYHQGKKPAFALACEAADLAVQAFENSTSLLDARQKLIESIESHARSLTAVSDELARRFDIEFLGIDFSLAPYPIESRSLGAAIEILGTPEVGLHSTLAAVAFIADAMERASFQKTGFCGLLMPVLEDAILAARTETGSLTVTDLLLYSAVCGTGLDIIPLPGDITTAELQAILLDVAALSLRLGKPLTARLMPIPGKKAGDLTSFQFPYFANSRVMGVRAAPLSKLWLGDEIINLKQWRRRKKPLS